MLMGQPPCPLMKGKRALGNSMVQYNCFLQLFHAFIFFDWFVHYVSIFHYFLAAVIYPSLAQLHEGINEVEDRKQKAICIERYRRREEDHKRVISEIDDNIEEECGICMEINNKVVLPTCSHAMCIKCYRDWYLSFLFSLYCRAKFSIREHLAFVLDNKTLLHDQDEMTGPQNSYVSWSHCQLVILQSI